MQKTFVYPAALFCLVIATLGCMKDQQSMLSTTTLPNQTISANVVAGENFTLVAGNTGTLSISKQALHYSISETANEDGSVYYNYHPSTGFIGSDEVTLAYITEATSPISTIGSSCSANHSTTSSTMQKILIKLTVTK